MAAPMIAHFVALMLIVVTCAVPLQGQDSPLPKSMTPTRLYIGTLDDGDSQGIYQGEIDLQTGNLQLHGLAAEAKNATFLAIHPSGKYLYATCEVDEYTASKAGAVAAFKINTLTGKLTFLNYQSSAGAVPCHVSLDGEGKFALVANYLGGNVAVLPINADGLLGLATSTVQHQGSSVHKVRQERPHPHSINLDCANRFAFVADAGTDEVLVYRFDSAAGTLTPNDPPALKTAPGDAPRHLAFHPNANWVYVINELSSTIAALRFDRERGALEAMQTVSTLPHGGSVENLTAEIIVHPNGRFLYGSNRGHDSIAIFAINQTTGKLMPLGQHPAGGRTPRNFSIDPTGKFLLTANQDAKSIVVHRIDPETGLLARTAHEINVPTPVCIKFVP